MFSPSGRLNFNSGDCMFIKSDNFVNTWEVNIDQSPSMIIAFRFHPKVLSLIYQDNLPHVITSKKTIQGPSIIKIKPEDSLKQFIKNTIFYLNNPQLLTEDMLGLKLKELIILISQLKGHTDIKEALKSLFHTQSIQFNTIIQSNLFENLKMKELAFICGLSLSSFNRQFQKVYQTSPAKYIREKRIEKSKEWLKDNLLSISEIAFKTGFKSPAHFTKTFKSVNLCSPSQYRKANIK